MKIDKQLKDISDTILRLPNDDNNNDGGTNRDFTTWYGKPVISIDEWFKVSNYRNYYSHPDVLDIQQMLQYFPDEYRIELLAFGVDEQYEDIVGEWWDEYVQLHQQILIWKYGPENFKRMLKEQDWQRERKGWDFHKSNMPPNHDDGRWVDGCTSLQCVPTCKFYNKSAQNPEALQLLQESGYKDKLLP
ncbi:MAG: hypothetical protein ACJ71O_13915 [Nitrososphaeraceae archaeon]